MSDPQTTPSLKGYAICFFLGIICGGMGACAGIVGATFMIEGVAHV